MLRELWLVVAHDLLEYRYMNDVTGNLTFSLFCSTWRAVLKMFVRLFRIKASENLWKSLGRVITKKKNGETETKKALDYLTMPWNYKKSSQQLPSCVIATRASLFCKIFSPLISFEQEKTVKNFSKKLYTSKLKKKLRRKVAFGTKKMPKLAQMLKQSSGARQVFVLVFFLCWSLYKTNRFHAAVGLFSNRLQRTSKCGKNIGDTCALAYSSCATSSFLPHFDVICDLLLNRRTATWNLFVKYVHFLMSLP